MKIIHEHGIGANVPLGVHARHSLGAPTKRTLALILAGGRGSRLEELTNWRAKPAIPFGGKFRIIDFTLSNCVNSGIVRRFFATHASPSLLHCFYISIIMEIKEVSRGARNPGVPRCCLLLATLVSMGSENPSKHVWEGPLFITHHPNLRGERHE